MFRFVCSIFFVAIIAVLHSDEMNTNDRDEVRRREGMLYFCFFFLQVGMSEVARLNVTGDAVKYDKGEK